MPDSVSAVPSNLPCGYPRGVSGVRSNRRDTSKESRRAQTVRDGGVRTQQRVRMSPYESAFWRRNSLIIGRRWRPGLWAGMLAAIVPSVGTGQAVDLKRVLPEPTPPLCPSAPPVSVSPSPADRAEADRLLARATELTLLGDAGAAVGLLRQAEQLNPASPDVAYRLGAAERDLGQANNAIVYYCRYLTLSPGAEDGDEVRELVSQLTPPRRASLRRSGGRALPRRCVGVGRGKCHARVRCLRGCRPDGA